LLSLALSVSFLFCVRAYLTPELLTDFDDVQTWLLNTVRESVTGDWHNRTRVRVSKLIPLTRLSSHRV